jgi:GTP-binding protein Era
MSKRCGYVALLGRPNAGKSTLLNALVGDKVAVVSRKPQTTRNRILGIALEGDAQVLFLDTPGIHKASGRNLINTTMNKVAMATAADADLILYLVDVAEGWREEDSKFLARILATSNAPFAVIASKIDALKRHDIKDSLEVIGDRIDALLASDEKLNERYLESAPNTISAKRPEDVAKLRKFMASHLPEGTWLFPEDDLTDMPQSFVCSELIREQLFRQLGQELPYGCAVKVESLQDKGDLVVLHAKILVTRKSHKGMVVGKAGSRIRELGAASRESLERHLGKKVFLDLSVSVAEGWIDDARLIAELAHIQELPDVAVDVGEDIGEDIGGDGDDEAEFAADNANNDADDEAGDVRRDRSVEDDGPTAPV